MTMWLLPAAHLLTTADRAMFMGVAPIIGRSFGLDNAQTGILLGPAIAVSYGVGAVVFGTVADRGRARMLLLGGVCAMIAAALLQAAAIDYPMLLAGRVCAGLAQAAVAPVALFLIVSQPVGHGHTRGLARFTAAAALGRSGGLLMAGIVLAGLAAAGITLTGVAARAGWRIALLAMIVPIALFLWAAARWIRDPAGNAGRPAGNKTRIPARLFPFFLAAFGPAIMFQATIAWGTPLLNEGLRIGIPAAAALFGTILLITAPPAQWLAGRMTAAFAPVRAYPFLVCAVSLAGAQAMLWLAVRGGGTWRTSAGMAGVIVLTGCASFTALHAVGAASPAGRRGATTGTFVAFATLVGVGAGPWLTGVLSGEGGGAQVGRALQQVGGGVTLFAIMLATVCGRRPVGGSAAAAATG